jgi:hypothetical protein
LAEFIQKGGIVVVKEALEDIVTRVTIQDDVVDIRKSFSAYLFPRRSALGKRRGAESVIEEKVTADSGKSQQNDPDRVEPSGQTQQVLPIAQDPPQTQEKQT